MIWASGEVRFIVAFVESRQRESGTLIERFRPRFPLCASKSVSYRIGVFPRILREDAINYTLACVV